MHGIGACILSTRGSDVSGVAGKGSRAQHLLVHGAEPLVAQIQTRHQQVQHGMAEASNRASGAAPVSLLTSCKALSSQMVQGPHPMYCNCWRGVIKGCEYGRQQCWHEGTQVWVP